MSSSSSMRIVPDTNVLVSGMLTGWAEYSSHFYCYCYFHFLYLRNRGDNRTKYLIENCLSGSPEIEEQRIVKNNS